MKNKNNKNRVIKQIVCFLSIALLLVIFTPSFSTNYQEALTAVQRNDLDKAQTLLSHTLSRNPNDLNSKTLFAIVTYRQGDYAAAETQLLELSTNTNLSKNDSILYMLADAQNTLGFKEEALNTIITAYEVNPENLSIQQLYTSIYYDLSPEYNAAIAQNQTVLMVPETENTETITTTSAPETGANILIQAVQEPAPLVTTRAMNTASPQAVHQTSTLQNALLAATQGTTLVPETTVVAEAVVATEALTGSMDNSSTLETEEVAGLDRPYTFEEASQSYAENKFNLARAQLENILAGNPYHLEAKKMLAQLAYRDGNVEQSVELYKSLTQTHQFIQNPEADVLYGLALAQRSLGDIEGAFNNVAQAILQTPDNAAMNRLYDNIVAELANQDSLQKQTVAYTFEEAMEVYNSGDIELARLQFQEIIKAQPQNNEAITMLAYIIYRDGNSEQAEAMFQSIVNQADFDENSDVLYGLALSQRNSGKLSDALASIQRAQVAAPDREDVRDLSNSLSAIVLAEREKALLTAASTQNQQSKLSFTFEDALEAYKANDIETAKVRFEALIAANPDDTDSAVLLAYIVYRTDSDEAVRMFTALTEREDFTENSDVLYGLALSHRNSGNLESAFASIERAYIAAPEREDVADLYTKLAGALEEARKAETTEPEKTSEENNSAANSEVSAETSTVEPATVEPATAEPATVETAEAVSEAVLAETLPYSFEDAVAAYKANDIETAKAQFEGLVAANPDDTDSATLLAYIVYRSDSKLAAAMFQNIVNRADFNENSDVLYGLALSERNSGNLEAAFTSIERAYIAAPEREDVKELYTQLNAALNTVADSN